MDLKFVIHIVSDKDKNCMSTFPLTVMRQTAVKSFQRRALRHLQFRRSMSSRSRVSPQYMGQTLGRVGVGLYIF